MPLSTPVTRRTRQRPDPEAVERYRGGPSSAATERRRDLKRAMVLAADERILRRSRPRRASRKTASVQYSTLGGGVRGATADATRSSSALMLDIPSSRIRCTQSSTSASRPDRSFIARMYCGPAESTTRHLPVKILSGTNATATAIPFAPSLIQSGARPCRAATTSQARRTSSLIPSDTMSMSPVRRVARRVSMAAPPTAMRCTCPLPAAAISESTSARNSVISRKSKRRYALNDGRRLSFTPSESMHPVVLDGRRVEPDAMVGTRPRSTHPQDFGASSGHGRSVGQSNAPATAVLPDPRGDRHTVPVAQGVHHCSDSRQIAATSREPVVPTPTAWRILDHRFTGGRVGGPVLNEHPQIDDAATAVVLGNQLRQGSGGDLCANHDHPPTSASATFHQGLGARGISRPTLTSCYRQGVSPSPTTATSHRVRFPLAMP